LFNRIFCSLTICKMKISAWCSTMVWKELCSVTLNSASNIHTWTNLVERITTRFREILLGNRFLNRNRLDVRSRLINFTTLGSFLFAYSQKNKPRGSGSTELTELGPLLRHNQQCESFTPRRFSIRDKLAVKRNGVFGCEKICSVNGSCVINVNLPDESLEQGRNASL